MRFTVIGPARSLPKQTGPGFVLMQDNWDDYGFQTQYHLFWTMAGSELRIGAVKILRRGQLTSDPIQIAQSFDDLAENFVSVGESLD